VWPQLHAPAAMPFSPHVGVGSRKVRWRLAVDTPIRFHFFSLVVVHDDVFQAVEKPKEWKRVLDEPQVSVFPARFSRVF
jgi:hypothetical protein